MAKQQLEKIADNANPPPQASADAREPPTMKSTCLTWQEKGHCFGHAFVRLPDGMLLQDLQDVPGIWKNVQQVPQTALRKFDRVTAVSFDESWMLKDCVVIDADATRAVLAIRPNDRISLSQKMGEWQDREHIIRWAGAGYTAFRRSDGVQVMTTQFGTLEAARSQLFREAYGRTV